MSPKRQRSGGGSAPNGRVAVYAGSFDPITRGHEDLIRRSFEFVDRLVVAVAINSSKQPLFEIDERLELIRATVGSDPRIEVRSFTGLLVDFAADVGARLIIRGLRAVSDFEYEFQMALINRSLHPKIEVVFLVPNEKFIFLSSSSIKEVAKLGGDVRAFVPPVVEKAFRGIYPGSRKKG